MNIPADDRFSQRLTPSTAYDPRRSRVGNRRQFRPPSITAFGLTNRELDILRLVAIAMSDRQIADQLVVGHGTARTHVCNILGKMDVPNRSAANPIARRERLVDLSDTG